MYYVRGGLVLPFLGIMAISFLLTQRSLVQGIALSSVIVVIVAA